MKLNQRTWIALGVLSAVILLVLGSLVYIYAANSSQTISVYQLRHDVVSGAKVVQDDVALVTVKQAGTEYGNAASGADLALASWSGSLHQNDVVRKDDVARGATAGAAGAAGGAGGGEGQAQAQVAITINNSPTLLPADTIDIYVNDNGALTLVGRHVPVVAVGSPLTISVPASTAAQWVSISASKSEVVAVKVAIITEAGQGVPKSAADAITCLRAVATDPAKVCSGGAGAAPGGPSTPAAAPSGSPAASPSAAAASVPAPS